MTYKEIYGESENFLTNRYIINYKHRYSIYNALKKKKKRSLVGLYFGFTLKLKGSVMPMLRKLCMVIR